MRIGWFVVAFALLIAGPGFADEESADKAQARTLLGQGNALFEKGDLRGALANFRAAYALYPSPKLLVNAAAAERELGDLPGAANDLRHFLDEVSDVSEDPFLVDKARQDLRAVERRVGRVSLSGWPQRSSIEVDGRLLRDTAYVKPGEHHVRAHTPGGVEVERDVNIQAGESVELAAPARLGLTGETGPVATPPRRKSRWWVGVVVGAVVAVGAGVGVGLGIGLTQDKQPLHGELGSVKFSDFH
jgi:hypothetical protein